MDWKLSTGTFVAIFVAEMGDKTQLAAFALSGGANSKWSVFLGASLALVATTAIAVLAGGLIGRHVPELWLKRGAGALFVVMGILMLLTKAPEQGAAPPAASDDLSAVSQD